MRHRDRNREPGQVLARDKTKSRPSFEHSVTLGPIEIAGGNNAEWAAKKNPDGLTVISVAGKHSDQLKRLHEGKARIDRSGKRLSIGAAR